MSRDPRNSVPPALLGYRNLRRAATKRESLPLEAEPTAGAATSIRSASRPTVRRRFVGALRIVAALSAVAVVVGTSVALASADPSDDPVILTKATKPVSSKSAKPAKPAETDVATITATPRDIVVDDDADSDAVMAVSAPAPAATAPASSTDLPFTGPREALLLLLAGATTLLMGMAVQIMVTPLPAYRR